MLFVPFMTILVLVLLIFSEKDDRFKDPLLIFSEKSSASKGLDF